LLFQISCQLQAKNAVCAPRNLTAQELSACIYTTTTTTCGQQTTLSGTFVTSPQGNQPATAPCLNQDSSPEPMVLEHDSDNDLLPFELNESELEAMGGEADTGSGRQFLEQKVHIDLLHILQKAEAPDYLFQHVVEWASRSRAQGYDFSPSLISRQAVLSNIRQHFNLQELQPSITELKLESVDKMIPMVTFDCYNLLMSLLTQVPLMQPDNLVINPATTGPDGSLDTSPWFKPYDSSNQALDEVLSGKWYNDTVEELGANAPGSKIFVCPLIIYVDKTFIDPSKSRFNLEPVNFTLAIFKRSCRTLFSFWRTLGFLPDVPNEDIHNPQKAVVRGTTTRC